VDRPSRSFDRRPSERTEFQRLPLGILDPALFLQGLVLLGLPGLALEVFELLADLVAQVAQPVQVLAGVADAGLGLLAALLVEMPAASRYTRRSSGRASMIWLIMPCSMIE
jgi:hypothetical protein